MSENVLCARKEERVKEKEREREKEKERTSLIRLLNNAMIMLYIIYTHTCKISILIFS